MSSKSKSNSPSSQSANYEEKQLLKSKKSNYNDYKSKGSEIKYNIKNQEKLNHKSFNNNSSLDEINKFINKIFIKYKQNVNEWSDEFKPLMYNHKFYEWNSNLALYTPKSDMGKQIIKNSKFWILSFASSLVSYSYNIEYFFKVFNNSAQIIFEDNKNDVSNLSQYLSEISLLIKKAFTMTNLLKIYSNNDFVMNKVLNKYNLNNETIELSVDDLNLLLLNFLKSCNANSSINSSQKVSNDSQVTNEYKTQPNKTNLDFNGNYFTFGDNEFSSNQLAINVDLSSKKSSKSKTNNRNSIINKSNIKQCRSTSLTNNINNCDINTSKNISNKTPKQVSKSVCDQEYYNKHYVNNNNNPSVDQCLNESAFDNVKNNIIIYPNSKIKNYNNVENIDKHSQMKVGCNTAINTKNNQSHGVISNNDINLLVNNLNNNALNINTIKNNKNEDISKSRKSYNNYINSILKSDKQTKFKSAIKEINDFKENKVSDKEFYNNPSLYMEKSPFKNTLNDNNKEVNNIKKINYCNLKDNFKSINNKSKEKLFDCFYKFKTYFAPKNYNEFNSNANNKNKYSIRNSYSSSDNDEYLSSNCKNSKKYRLNSYKNNEYDSKKAELWRNVNIKKLFDLNSCNIFSAKTNNYLATLPENVIQEIKSVYSNLVNKKASINKNNSYNKIVRDISKTITKNNNISENKNINNKDNFSVSNNLELENNKQFEMFKNNNNNNNIKNNNNFHKDLIELNLMYNNAQHQNEIALEKIKHLENEINFVKDLIISRKTFMESVKLEDKNNIINNNIDKKDKNIESTNSIKLFNENFEILNNKNKVFDNENSRITNNSFLITNETSQLDISKVETKKQNKRKTKDNKKDSSFVEDIIVNTVKYELSNSKIKNKHKNKNKNKKSLNSNNNNKKLSDIEEKHRKIYNLMNSNIKSNSKSYRNSYTKTKYSLIGSDNKIINDTDQEDNTSKIKTKNNKKIKSKNQNTSNVDMIDELENTKKDNKAINKSRNTSKEKNLDKTKISSYSNISVDKVNNHDNNNNNIKVKTKYKRNKSKINKRL